VVWTSSPEKDDGKKEEASHHDDFGAGEPELGLAVELDGQYIQSDNDDDHD
jgi:hypothetical protein